METEMKAKVDPAVAQSLEIERPLEMAAEHMNALEQWLTTAIDDAETRRGVKLEKIARYRKTLRGINPDPPLRRGVSNVSVPLTMWVVSGTQARVERGLTKPKPSLSIRTTGKFGGEEGRALDSLLSKFAAVLEGLIEGKRAFNGKRAQSHSTTEQVRWGLGAIKVMYTPDSVVKIPGSDGVSGIQKAKRGTIKWHAIPFDMLLYPEGYSDDVADMPFIGHDFTSNWAKIAQWSALGYYYPEQVDAVRAYYRENETGSTPEALREHDLQELYCDFDVDGDGILESVVVDRHRESGRILRVGWNQFGGHKPIALAQFDHPANLEEAQGQGLCEKLDGPQMEANAIHNITIEAGKRGIAHLIVTKQNTGVDEELGDNEGIIPGTNVTTDNPMEDITAIPLGDPNAALVGIQLEELNRVYATRLSGMDEARIGNVESGQRVPASLGLPTMKEGRTMIERALESAAAQKEECIYLSIELLRKRFPIEALRTVMSNEEIISLQNIIYNLDGDDIRSALVVRANALDAAAAMEERKMELFTLNQFLFGVYDRLMNMIPLFADPNVPQGARDIAIKVMEKVSAGVHMLLNSIDSVTDPEDLLISMAELNEMISTINQATSGGGGLAATDAGAGIT